MPSLPVFALALIPLVCHASPINRQVGLSENVFMTTQNGTDGLEHRVCSIDAVTYLDGETIPTSSPCEHCVCRPPGFACTITSCEYRPGCKAFRRSDQCCPEYQCECEKDGKIYQNGEKIMDNNNPCEVCYCQGGEIICAVIDCYWRNDCPPRYIDNRCCPMYDHCPPPSAQGPIRHRLPSLSSPISWHNITSQVQPSSSQQPPLVEVITSATSTTTTTTTTTTEASSAAPETVDDNAVLSDSAPVEPEQDIEHETVAQNAPVEPVLLTDIQTSSTVAPTEPAQELQQSNDENVEQQNDPPTTAGVPLSDHADDESVTVQPTPVVENLVSTTVIDSTTLFVAPALILTIAPTSVQEVVRSDATAHPQLDVVSDPVEQTTAEPPAPVSQNDEAVVTTSVPSDVEIFHDVVSNEPQITESLVRVTESVISEDHQHHDEILFDSVSHADEVVSNSNLVAEPASSNDVGVTSESPTERILHDTVQDEESSPVQTDTEVATTQRQFQDEVQTTVEPVQEANDIVLQDNPVTTAIPSLDASEEVVAADSSAIGSDHEVHDAYLVPESTTVFENVVSHDEVTTVPPINDDVRADDISNDEEVRSTLPPEPEAQQDEVDNRVSITLTPIHKDSTDEVSHEESFPTDSPTSADNAQDDEISHSDGVTTEHPVYSAQNDEASIGSTEDPIASADDDHIIHRDDSAEPTVGYYSVSETSTQRSDASVVQEDEDVIFNDEIETTSSVSHDATLGPEYIQHDDTVVVHAEDDVQTATHVEHGAEAEVQQDAVTTQLPPQESNHINEVFDIILDDEVIPSQPETLNLVKDNPGAIIQNEYNLVHDGVSSDNDTVEIVNLSAVPLDKVSIEPESTTLAPEYFHVVTNVEGEEDQPSFDHIEGHPHIEDHHTTEPSHIHLHDDEESSTVVSNDEPPTTERELRLDNEIFRHHLGVPHDDEENSTTPVAPVEVGAESRQEVVYDGGATVSYADEQQQTTVVPDQVSNKVQKVSEALSQHRVESHSEEYVGNKFRLDVGSLENFSFESNVNDEAPVDVTTVPPSFNNVRSSQENEVSNDVSPTTQNSQDVPVFADNVEYYTTQSPPRYRDGIVDDTTVGPVYDSTLNDAVTVGQEVQNDEPVTTPQARFDLSEGSGENPGVQDDEMFDAVEGSGVSHDVAEPIPTTSHPLNDDENSIVPTESIASYAFRMDLSSVEDTNKDDTEVQESHVSHTTAPSSLDRQEDFVEVTTEPVLQDEPVTNAYAVIVDNEVQQDEVTTEPVAKFRTDLDVTTPLPVESEIANDHVPEHSTVVADDVQDDFVEVSTHTSSGFAAAFRDGLDDDTVTQIPDVSNDDVTTIRLHDAAADMHHDDVVSNTDKYRFDLEFAVNDETTVRSQSEFAHLQDEAQTPAFDDAPPDTTVPSGRSDLEQLHEDEVASTVSPVFADEVEGGTTPVENIERLRTEQVPTMDDQQTEIVNDHVSLDDSDVVAPTTTENSVVEKVGNQSTSNQKMVKAEAVVLPETGMPKIQPISPDLSRNDPHEFRFDFQLPPETDSTWLSRAVSQFRRLTGFAGNQQGRRNKAVPPATRPRIPTHRFLLF